MKFYKLELINREHSYNNMFGNNPNVGVINPMGMVQKVAGKPGLPPTGLSTKDMLAKKKPQQVGPL